jgi:hypothetical protein
LKIENGILKIENGILKIENGILKIENGILKMRYAKWETEHYKVFLSLNIED